MAEDFFKDLRKQAQEEYREAQKLAMKEYRACISRGEYPYLPALDDFVSAERCAAGTSLGVVQVPAEFIVGTKTRGRTHSFARNFMPLLEDTSEFGEKWKRLCDAHLSEGIRDAVKVYEYMNRYYVEEGNKRVSVLKYFNAAAIPAQVIRVLPEQNGDLATEIYFEFVTFYRYSKINLLEFTKKGSYASLQRQLGKGPEEPWTDEERSRFHAAYHRFREAYRANGGDKLASTVGDALLAYIKVYGYQALCAASPAELKKTVAKMWEEITLQQDQSPIQLKLDPGEEKKPGILSRVLPTAAPKMRKVAFLYDKTPERSGWVHGHELGRQHVQRVFDGKITTKAYSNVMEADPQAVLEQAIGEGNTVVFTTSPRLLPASLRVAVEHPEVTIFNCSLNTSHRYIRTYYARMYEVKFILGAMAGALTKHDRLGYVCDYPIYGQIAGINAFALGAQMVNPRVKVYLEWSSTGGSEAALARLTSRDIHLISSQDMTRMDDDGNTSFGLSHICQEERFLLAAPVWQWGVYYEGMLRGILDKTVQTDYESSNKALNYYWGMSAGVVDLFCSERVPESVRKLASYLKESVCRGACNPFLGAQRTQSGDLVGAQQSALSLEQIINMDYLVDNVVGAIPVYEELNPVGKATVDMVGVEPAAKHTTDSTEAEK